MDKNRMEERFRENDPKKESSSSLKEEISKNNRKQISNGKITNE